MLDQLQRETLLAFPVQLGQLALVERHVRERWRVDIGADVDGSPVLVKADRAVPYGNVVGAMVLLQQGGADSIGFVTDPLDTYPVPE